MLKINSALTLDHTRSQWVDLKIHTEACMTRMDCGAAGGAISVWVSVNECTGTCGVISSSDRSTSTSFLMYLFSTGLRYGLLLYITYYILHLINIFVECNFSNVLKEILWDYEAYHLGFLD